MGKLEAKLLEPASNKVKAGNVVERKKTSWKCPECKEEIMELLHIESGQRSTFVFLSEKEILKDGIENFESDNDVNEYRCPECNRIVATSEEEAAQFFGKTFGHEEVS